VVLSATVTVIASQAVIWPFAVAAAIQLDLVPLLDSSPATSIAPACGGIECRFFYQCELVHTTIPEVRP
jgi:hypothetical protein